MPPSALTSSVNWPQCTPYGIHAPKPASQPQQPSRPRDVSGLTASELERTRRELAANLALVRPDSPSRVPILAHISAIDTELAGRTGQPP
jgi:hypothetical protein